MHNVKYVNKAHYTLALKRQEGISEWHQFETRYITASDMTASCQQDISKWYDSLLPTGYQVMRAYCQSISASDSLLPTGCQQVMTAYFQSISASDMTAYCQQDIKWWELIASRYQQVIDSLLPTGCQQVMTAYFQSISTSDMTVYCQQDISKWW